MISRFVRVVPIRNSPGQDLVHADLAGQDANPGVQSPRQGTLLNPRIGDEEPEQKLLGRRPVPQRRQDLTAPPNGDDKPLLESHPARHPVQFEKLRDPTLITRQPPANLDLLGPPQ